MGLSRNSLYATALLALGLGGLAGNIVGSKCNEQYRRAAPVVSLEEMTDRPQVVLIEMPILHAVESPPATSGTTLTSEQIRRKISDYEAQIRALGLQTETAVSTEQYDPITALWKANKITRDQMLVWRDFQLDKQFHPGVSEKTIVLELLATLDGNEKAVLIQDITSNSNRSFITDIGFFRDAYRQEVDVKSAYAADLKVGLEKAIITFPQDSDLVESYGWDALFLNETAPYMTALLPQMGWEAKQRVLRFAEGERATLRRHRDELPEEIQRQYASQHDEIIDLEKRLNEERSRNEYTNSTELLLNAARQAFSDYANGAILNNNLRDIDNKLKAVDTIVGDLR